MIKEFEELTRLYCELNRESFSLVLTMGDLFNSQTFSLMARVDGKPYWFTIPNPIIPNITTTNAPQTAENAELAALWLRNLYGQVMYERAV